MSFIDKGLASDAKEKTAGYMKRAALCGNKIQRRRDKTAACHNLHGLRMGDKRKVKPN